MSERNLLIGLMNNLTTTNFGEGVIDADINLTANSDTVLATQKAVKSYVNNSIAGITGGLRYKGVLDASNLGTQLSSNNKKGDLYKVSVAGTILGSLVLNVGDMIIINKDVISVPTKNDLDVIDNTEDISSPLSIDASVDILSLPANCYIFDGIMSTAKNHPSITTTSTHSTIMVLGKEGNKVIIYTSTIWGGYAFFVKFQNANVWGAWYTYYSYNAITSNRAIAESLVYCWSINSKQVYSKFLSGTAPTNNSTLIITPTTGVTSKLVSYDGWILKKGTNQRVPLNSLIANTTDLTNASPIYQDVTTGSIYLYVNSDIYNGQSFELTVYYTK